MELSNKELRKMLPNLEREIEVQKMSVSVDSFRRGKSERRLDPLRGYKPDIIDFLRRCDSDEEGEEIILFLEKRGEITDKRAEKLRIQLRAKGVRSFGAKKGANYYSRGFERD